MRGYKERHQREQELLGTGFVAEESILVDNVQLTLGRMRKSLTSQWDWLSSIETQKLVKPSLDLIIEGVSDRVSHCQLFEPLETVQLLTLGVVLLPDLLDKFQGQGSSRSFVTIDCAAHEHVVRPEERLYIRQRNRSSLINYYQVGMPDFVGIVGENELDELSVRLFNLDPYDFLFVVLVGTIDLLIIHPVFEVQGLKS